MSPSNCPTVFMCFLVSWGVLPCWTAGDAVKLPKEMGLLGPGVLRQEHRSSAWRGADTFRLKIAWQDAAAKQEFIVFPGRVPQSPSPKLGAP